MSTCTSLYSEAPVYGRERERERKTLHAVQPLHAVLLCYIELSLKSAFSFVGKLPPCLGPLKRSAYRYSWIQIQNKNWLKMKIGEKRRVKWSVMV